MPSRRPVLVPALCAFVGAACLPSAAAAQASPTGGAEAAPQREVATASAGPVSVRTRAGALLNRRTSFRGRVPAADAGRTVVIERLDPRSGGWSAVADAVAAGGGRYVARWKTDRVGPQDLRVRVLSPRASAASATPQVAVTVFRAARATWYGPGFFGRRTACGMRLRHSTMGVAHRRLPCGTPVTVFFEGRSLTVPVIDRGPFVRGVAWDLTAATARAVGFTGTATIGVLPQRRPAGTARR